MFVDIGRALSLRGDSYQHEAHWIPDFTQNCDMGVRAWAGKCEASFQQVTDDVCRCETQQQGKAVGFAQAARWEIICLGKRSNMGDVTSSDRPHGTPPWERRWLKNNFRFNGYKRWLNKIYQNNLSEIFLIMSF